MDGWPTGWLAGLEGSVSARFSANHFAVSARLRHHIHVASGLGLPSLIQRFLGNFFDEFKAPTRLVAISTPLRFCFNQCAKKLYWKVTKERERERDEK